MALPSSGAPANARSLGPGAGILDPRVSARAVASSSGEQGFDPSHPGSIAPILIPHEIECLKELLTVIGKLDTPTQTNIRDSLLRLAKNADMRKQGVRTSWKEVAASEGARKVYDISSGIDREVAQLLFSNSFDFQRTPASDARREAPAFPDGGSGNGSFPS